MRLLNELSDQARSLVLDWDEYLTDPGDFDKAVERAVARFSMFRPQLKITDLTGDGSAFRFDLPADWQIGGSRIQKILYPYDTTVQSLPEEVTRSDYTVMRKTATADELWCNGVIFASGKTARVYYTVEHTVTATSSTLQSAIDETSVIYWAAADCLRIMAAAATAQKNPNLNLSLTEGSGKGSAFDSLAKRYEELSGLLDGPAISFGPIIYGTAAQQDYLTH